MSNAIPQDILDKLFLLSDIDMVQQTREFQSDYVKAHTKCLAFNEAVKAEDLVNLRWLKRNGRSGDSNSFLFAAETGNLEILEWLKENGCEWNKRIFNKVMKNSNEDVVEWFKKNGESGVAAAEVVADDTPLNKRETRHSKKIMKQQAIGGTQKTQWYMSAWTMSKKEQEALPETPTEASSASVEA